MRKKKDRTYTYIVGSLMLILIGIVTTNVIDKIKSSNSTDIRARAGNDRGLQSIGTITGIDIPSGTITVDGFHFASNPNQNLGTWIVSVPTGYNFRKFGAGEQIRIFIDQTSYNIAKHTVVAKDIRNF